MSSTALDEVDLKLLEILQENADLTYAEIAKKVGVSPSTAYMRIKRLKERGFIKKIVAVVNPELLGFRLKALIFMSIDVKKFAKVVEALSGIPQVQDIYDVTGEWTLVCSLLVQDHTELSKVLDQIGSVDGVLNTSTLIVLRTIKENKVVLP
ncbi:MAG: Lrp/AsnC family transcriptional regulator [Sulfolobales archaeon]|nr:Lrp/AsnC family transcriptional regulator [Sulfolobales archaeon]MCX8208273.1 Lrp/AsnC family transcriptional regulator [Sulfolobales archaeon]MDW8011108.1 Lrp/AsnC family transcriptional regulator [Sulfolobales archaeon]